MTALAGEKQPSVISGSQNPRVSNSLSEYAVDYWLSERFGPFPTHTAAMRPFDDAEFDWTPGLNLPVAQGLGPKNTAYVNSYKQDFYYRVHIRPSTVDFGNLVNTETQEVSVWNAFFEPVFFSDLGDPSQPGISYALSPDVPLPYYLAPQREVTLLVTASIAGPPNIDSEFTITIDGEETVIHAVGRRIAIFPFPPNWRNQVDSTLAFQSWVLRSSNGTVQTGSQWGNAPRRELEYTILLKRDDAARAENLLMGWQSRYYGVVMWPHETKLAVGAPAGSRSIYCDTQFRAFGPTGFVIIYVDSTTYESAEIESVVDGLVTITSDLLHSWPAGTKVYPVFAGLINASLSGMRHTDGVVEMPVSFESEPSVMYGTAPLVEPALTYRGVELYLGRLNWISGIEFQFESDRHVFDMNTGRTMSYSGANFTPQQKQHNWFFKTLEDGWMFEQWLARRQGVAKPCYIPTGNSDLTLIADPLEDAVTIDVIDNEYTSMLGAHPIRRDIIMLMRDGTYYPRRVTGVSNFSGGARITVDTPWPTTIDRTQVKRISFLGLFRQVGNKATISWLAQGKGTAEMMLINDKAD